MAGGTDGDDDSDDDDDNAEREMRPLLAQRRKEVNKTGRGSGPPPLPELEEDEAPVPSE